MFSSVFWYSRNTDRLWYIGNPCFSHSYNYKQRLLYGRVQWTRFALTGELISVPVQHICWPTEEKNWPSVRLYAGCYFVLPVLKTVFKNAAHRECVWRACVHVCMEWCGCVCVSMCVLDGERSRVVAGRAVVLRAAVYLSGYHDCLTGFCEPLSPLYRCHIGLKIVWRHHWGLHSFFAAINRFFPSASSPFLSGFSKQATWPECYLSHTMV